MSQGGGGTEMQYSWQLVKHAKLYSNDLYSRLQTFVSRRVATEETQTAVVWSCFPFIRSGQNHLARHSERGKKTRQTEEEVGRQHQEMNRPGVRQVPEGSGEQGKMEKTGCKIVCGAPTTLAVKGLMMMMPLKRYDSLLGRGGGGGREKGQMGSSLLSLPE